MGASKLNMALVKAQDIEPNTTFASQKFTCLGRSNRSQTQFVSAVSPCGRRSATHPDCPIFYRVIFICPERMVSAR
jgi:hypothetical protein